VTGAKEVKKKNGESEWLGKGQARPEGWSESEDKNKKWLNMEITVYAFYELDLKGRNKQDKELKPNKINYAFQLYGRRGTHSSKKRCGRGRSDNTKKEKTGLRLPTEDEELLIIVHISQSPLIAISALL
jgi:hypothetical protein